MVGSPALAAGSGTLINEKQKEKLRCELTHILQSSHHVTKRFGACSTAVPFPLLSSDRGDVANLRGTQLLEFYGLLATLATPAEAQ